MNIFTESDYRQLDKVKKYVSWRTAFENLAGAKSVTSPEETLESLSLIENNDKKESIPFLESEEKLILNIIQNNMETLGVDKISEISNLTP